jgi:tetratricopeptide (TPR) repeat protein
MNGFMKWHLFFVLALGVCFCTLNFTLYGQGVPTARAAASGGDISRTNIVIIPQEKVEELVRDVKRLREGLTTQQRENVALLRKKLDLNEAQVLAALDILAENDISLELIAVKLVEIAGRFQALERTLSPLPGNDPEAAALEAEALKAIGAGELSTADALIADVEARQRHVLERAGTLAKRGEIALARLRYVEAAAHFAKAAGVLPPGSAYEDKRIGYLIRRATSLYQQGEEFGDNGALRRAIELYKRVIDGNSRERMPLQWAAIQNNLGNALRVLGNRESGTVTLEGAVGAYREALKELNRERVPLDWATTQTNLGSALLILAAREGGTAKLEDAVAAYREALKEQTRERVPLDWAMTQNNLGIALRVLGEDESGTVSLEESVAAYREALKELTRERVPLDWATTQNNLASALLVIGQREKGTAKLEEAVTAYREALREWTRERVPIQWATVQNNLGVALRTLGEREDTTAKLEEAVVAYREALKEWTRDRAPFQWAATQNNLGNALRVLGERTAGTAELEEAIAAYRDALKELTRERVELEWATTQINLGSALLILGERESGTTKLDESVAAYREALRELTYERAPSLWTICVGSQGVALMQLAERRGDAALAQGALDLINTVVELMRDSGEPSALAYYERHLAAARTSALRFAQP